MSSVNVVISFFLAGGEANHGTNWKHIHRKTLMLVEFPTNIILVHFVKDANDQNQSLVLMRF